MLWHLALIFLLPIPLLGQNPLLLDSLLSQKEQNEFLTDSAKGAFYLELMRAYYPLSLDSAIRYNELAHETALDLNLPSMILKTKTNRGVFLFNQGAFEEAEKQYSEVLQDLSKIESPVERMSTKMLAYWNLGNVNNARGHYAESMNQYLASAVLADSLDEPARLANLYINISICCHELGLTDERLKYLRKTVTLYSEIQNPFIHGTALTGIGNHYTEINEDSAVFYFDQALAVLDTLPIPRLIFEIQTGKGQIHIQKGEFQRGLSRHALAYQASLQSKSNVQQFRAACNLGYTYLKLGRMDSAAYYFRIFDELTQGEGSLYFIGGCYEQLIEYYEIIGQYQKANTYYRILKEVNDSLFNRDVNRSILEMDRKYQTALGEAQLLEQQIEIDRKTRQRNRYLGLAILIGVISTISFFYSRQLNRKNKEIIIKENQIQNQRINELEKEQKILSMAAMLEGQENERIRIAKDLHDGLGVLLSSIRRQVQAIQNNIKKLAQVNLVDDTEQMIAHACNEVRRISHDMMPDALVNLGLKEAVTDLGEQLQEETSLQVFMEIADDLILSKSQMINMYRIIQESAQNTVKHAQARQFKVRITQDVEQLFLEISDDGKGMGAEVMEHTTGIGISNIRSRVELLHGTIKIHSDHGVQYQIIIPKDQEV